MEKVIITTARTENGYSGSCSLLPGWIVAHTGNFDEFKKEVQESIDFYVECAKADGDSYSTVFDGEYKLAINSMCSRCWSFTGGFSLSLHCKLSPALIKNSWRTTPLAFQSQENNKKKK